MGKGQHGSFKGRHFMSEVLLRALRWYLAFPISYRDLTSMLSQPHVVNPRTITVDKNPSYPRAVRQMKRSGELWRFSRLRQRKYLNDIVEQDHCRIKRLVGPRPWR